MPIYPTHLYPDQVATNPSNGYVPVDDSGIIQWQDPALVLNRILVSLSGDVITAGGQVIYSNI